MQVQSAISNANLVGSNLRNSDLSYANLLRADLSGADLYSADLRGANLTNSFLDQANFEGSIVGLTTFGDVGLHHVKGLLTLRHLAPSTVGIDTIYRSGGDIPELFLRRAGVPEDFITYMRSLTLRPIQFYSCFISYSSKNQPFADRLYVDLQTKGVRCWLASEDLKIGGKIRIDIDESIRVHDKLLLVLSKYSVASDWVEQEVETALSRERKEKRIVLFPIRLDDSVMKIHMGWPALIKNTRNIGDFRKWKQLDSYQKAFDKLLRDLKAEDKGSNL
ncbi:MAG TPA: TIR domain-containing protein [Pyrinomonadaceae bacterium]|jgi:hypothetical protein